MVRVPSIQSARPDWVTLYCSGSNTTKCIWDKGDGCMAKWPDELDDQVRIEQARERTNRLVSHISTLFMMHEANKIATYSPRLSSQIPRSFAAHSFSQFQQSMHLFEVLRLAAIWDGPSRDRESIPTIVALYDKPSIVDRLAKETHAYHANMGEPRELTPTSDPEDAEVRTQFWKIFRAKRAVEEQAKTRRRLVRARWSTERVARAPAFQSIRQFRDRFLAHNLTNPEPDLSSASEPPRVMKYGDERRLLNVTVSVANLLHLGLNGACFDWEGSRDIARRAADELWGNCRFEIPQR